MIEITKGNPSPEEIAALVAVLSVVSGTAGTATHPVTNSAVSDWRRSKSFGEMRQFGLHRRDQPWRTRSSGWSRVSQPDNQSGPDIPRAADRNVS